MESRCASAFLMLAAHRFATVRAVAAAVGVSERSLHRSPLIIFPASAGVAGDAARALDDYPFFSTYDVDLVVALVPPRRTYLDVAVVVMAELISALLPFLYIPI